MDDSSSSSSEDGNTISNRVQELTGIPLINFHSKSYYKQQQQQQYLQQKQQLQQRFSPALLKIAQRQYDIYYQQLMNHHGSTYIPPVVLTSEECGGGGRILRPRLKKKKRPLSSVPNLPILNSHSLPENDLKISEEEEGRYLPLDLLDNNDNGLESSGEELSDDENDDEKKFNLIQPPEKCVLKHTESLNYNNNENCEMKDENNNNYNVKSSLRKTVSLSSAVEGGGNGSCCSGSPITSMESWPIKKDEKSEFMLFSTHFDLLSSVRQNFGNFDSSKKRFLDGDEEKKTLKHNSSHLEVAINCLKIDDVNTSLSRKF